MADGQHPESGASRRLSVVVPAYNAVAVIADTVAALRRDLTAALGPDAVEIIVVDDGSHDGTAARAREAGADAVLSLPNNRGKGAAVRAGMAQSSGATVVFTDADLSYPPDQVLRVAAAIDDGADVAIGSRTHAGAGDGIPPSALRQLSGRLFNLLTRVVLRGRYGDTQCGLKGFGHDVAHRLATESRIDGFAFDVELLHLAERDGLVIREVPAEVRSSGRSSVNLALHVPQMVRDVVLMWWHSRSRQPRR